MGLGATELSKRFVVSEPSVSTSVKRGEKIVKDEQLLLEDDYRFIILWASLSILLQFR